MAEIVHVTPLLEGWTYTFTEQFKSDEGRVVHTEREHVDLVGLALVRRDHWLGIDYIYAFERGWTALGFAKRGLFQDLRTWIDENYTKGHFSFLNRGFALSGFGRVVFKNDAEAMDHAVATVCWRPGDYELKKWNREATDAEAA